MKNGTRIFLIILIILLMLGYIAAFTYCTVQKYAYAEPIDNVELVNFNQLILNDYIESYTYSNSGINDVMYAVMKSNHKYYIKFDFNSFVDNTIAYRDSQSHWVGLCNLDELTNTHYSNIFTCTVDNSYLYVYVRTNPSTISNFCLIDLTLMFGDNIPTLTQADDLFVANYYRYNTGSVVSLNTIDAYNNGVNDTLAQYQTTVLNYGAFSSCYIYEQLSPHAELNKYIDYEVSDIPYLKFRGYLAVPLNQTVKAGTIITFTVTDPGMGGAGGDYLWAGILYNGNFIPAINCDIGQLYQFVCPYDTDTFMMSVSNSQTQFNFYDVGKWIGDFTVSGANIDLEAIIQAAKDGYKNELSDYYATYYGQYGQGYADIFAQGRAEGVLEANTNLNVMQYMKTAFITLGEILQIEVFPNFTLGAFFMLPIITSAIFFVIKIAKGGS